MIKRFHSNLLYASNLEETFRFYKKLGLEPHKSQDTVCVKLGGFSLSFIDENKTLIKNESGKNPKGLGIYFYVEVENVDKYFSEIKENGIVPRTEPKTWLWGKREFVVKDPDGYKLVFFSPVK